MGPFLEYDTATGRVCAIYFGTEAPEAPEGRAFADAAGRSVERAVHYDAATDTLTCAPAPAPPSKTISKLDFLRLLTPQEYGTFVAAAATDATLAYGKAMLDAAFTMSATEPTFQQMLAYCVSHNIFTSSRAAAIVAAMQA